MVWVTRGSHRVRAGWCAVIVAVVVTNSLTVTVERATRSLTGVAPMVSVSALRAPRIPMSSIMGQKKRVAQQSTTPARTASMTAGGGRWFVGARGLLRAVCVVVP